MTNEEIYEKLREAKLILIDGARFIASATTDDGFEIPDEGVRVGIIRSVDAALFKIEDVMNQLGVTNENPA